MGSKVLTSRLFDRHERGLVLTLAEVQHSANVLRPLPMGAAGSLTQRVKAGQTYWYRQFYDAAGRKRDAYIGPAGSAAIEERLAAERHWLQAAHALESATRTLRRNGFQSTDGRTAAMLAALANGGYFAAGLTLVGAHAYAAHCNALGLKTVALATQDVDVVRSARMSLPGGSLESLLAVLAKSGLPFTEVPAIDPRQPSSSLKLPGAERLRLDLLAPAKQWGVIAVPELAFAAQTLPLLDWLVQDHVQGVVLGPTLAIPVRLPQPARLAWHKLWTAAQPDREVAKAAKDVTQGLILASAMAEDDPQALADALQSLPARARQLALRRLRPELRRVAGHAQAMAVLADLVEA